MSRARYYRAHIFVLVILEGHSNPPCRAYLDPSFHISGYSLTSLNSYPENNLFTFLRQQAGERAALVCRDNLGDWKVVSGKLNTRQVFEPVAAFAEEAPSDPEAS